MHRHRQAGGLVAATVEVQIGGAILAGVEQRDVDTLLELIALLPEETVIEALSADDQAAKLYLRWHLRVFGVICERAFHDCRNSLCRRRAGIPRERFE